MIRAISAILFLALVSAGIHAAEDEIVLLSFDAGLIGQEQTIDHKLATPEQAAALIQAYYQLLPEQMRDEASSLHAQILRFIPGFEVAYTAADSAEIAHIMSEIDLRLAAIQEIHRDKFTQEVAEILIEAYQLILPTFGDEQ